MLRNDEWCQSGEKWILFILFFFSIFILFSIYFLVLNLELGFSMTLNKIISPSTFSSTITFNNQHSTLPTAHLLNSMGMDKSTETIPVNSIETRGRTPQIDKNLSRYTSMSSTCSSIIYHERVAMNNGIDVDSNLLVESPALSHRTEQEKELCLSKAAKTTTNTRLQDEQ